MPKARLEAFSDGVIAIIITIMVLEFKVPSGEEWKDLLPLLPKFVSYIFGFILVGTYWNNHHHLTHAAHGVTASIMWSNLALLLVLALVPFTVAWMGETSFAIIPTFIFTLNQFLCAMAFQIFYRRIIFHEPKDSVFRTLTSSRSNFIKNALSMGLVLLAPISVFIHPYIGLALTILNFALWIIPSKRVEKQVRHK